MKVIAKNYTLRILCVHQRQRDSTLLISNWKLNVKFDRTQVVFPSLKECLTLVSFIRTLEFWCIFFYLYLFQYCKICCCLPSKTSAMLLDLQLNSACVSCRYLVTCSIFSEILFSLCHFLLVIIFCALLHHLLLLALA